MYILLYNLTQPLKFIDYKKLRIYIFWDQKKFEIKKNSGKFNKRFIFWIIYFIFLGTDKELNIYLMKSVSSKLYITLNIF